MLTKDQVKFYKDNGFIKLSNIFTDAEIKEISEEYDDLFKRKKSTGLRAEWQGNEMKKAANQEPVTVLSIHNLQFHSDVFTRLIMNKNLLDALECIMDTPNILLHHTKAHLKPPENGAPYLMHQHSMVAAFINLDDSSPENGGLCVYPGSHKLGPLEDVGVIEKGEAFHYVDPKIYPISKATPIEAKKGDVIVFSYLLLHGSYLNTSERVRRMFLIQLMNAEDDPVEDVHKSPAQGMVLRGKNVRRDATMATRFVK
ncbi:hypothetical protein C0J52_08782 [Blattella germanica]|nr:hypothetical protein C0J52_08782 [Blattella germanica]